MSTSISEGPAWWGGWTGQRRHEHGFRLNVMDLVLGSASVAASLAIASFDMPLWWAPAYLFATFFMFCNVLRIARGYELAWCAIVAATTLGAAVLAPMHLPMLLPTVGVLSQIALGLAAVRAGQTRGIFAAD